jgi:signal transduction histidine kinase
MPGNPLILVIDDDPVVHKLLSAMLRKEGYDVQSAMGGNEGLQSIRQNRPDLVLLDIMMPEINGFDVIRILKKDSETKDIPVVILSAKGDAGDRVLGLELGAADFINKPFDRAELLARIRTQVKLKQQEDQLKRYSKDLEKMVDERTRMLIHADRLASLGTLSAGIAHEINNPTTFITGNLQTLEQFWKKAARVLGTHPDAQTDSKIQFLLKEFPAMIQSIRHGADRITTIVSGLKTFSRKDTPVKGRTDIGQCLDEALQLTHNHLKYHVTVEKEIPADLPSAWANSQHLVQVFVNIIMNAADAIRGKDGRLTIRAGSERDGRVHISFTDTGSGIPEGIQDKIFDPFFTTKPMGQGTGLGLSITHGIIKNHKGAIRVESETGRGTTFHITLPTEPDDHG